MKKAKMKPGEKKQILAAETKKYRGVITKNSMVLKLTAEVETYHSSLS